MEMICPECGSSFENQSVCSVCGAKLVPEEMEKEAEKLYAVVLTELLDPDEDTTMDIFVDLLHEKLGYDDELAAKIINNVPSVVVQNVARDIAEEINEYIFSLSGEVSEIVEQSELDNVLIQLTKKQDLSIESISASMPASMEKEVGIKKDVVDKPQSVEIENETVDQPGCLANTICFILPIVGLIMWAVNKNSKPNCAKSYITWAIVGFVLNLVLQAIS